MATSRVRPTHRYLVENEMIRKRDKQLKHEQLWQQTTKYYHDFEKKNQKYDEWTSPRYYATNTKLINDLQQKRNKEEQIERRRNELRQLLQEDEKFYQIELMIQKTKKQMTVNDDDNNQFDIMKDLNQHLKIEENDRQRHQAELKLYQQWRNTNPVLNEYQRYQQMNDIKLSWLDQQIEKRIEKQQEEEECRRLLEDNQKRIDEEQKKIEENRRMLQEKQQQLQADLQKQIDELNEKKRISVELQLRDDQDLKKRFELERIEEISRNYCDKYKNKECALFNLKQYKIKLKKKAQLIEETLDDEQELLKKLQQFELIELIEDQMKRNELRTTLDQLMIYQNEQKQLEKVRQQHFECLFDSELKQQYEQQSAIWQQEQLARQRLINDILETIKEQIEANRKRNQEERKLLLEERELLLKQIEEYDNEIEKLKQQEIELTQQQCDENQKLLKLKQLRKRKDGNYELKRINNELENIRKEEERLKREIWNLQRRQGPIRPDYYDFVGRHCREKQCDPIVNLINK